MNTLDQQDLNQSVHQLTQSAENAVAQGSPECLEQFEKQLNDLDALTRELQQSMWSAEVKQAIKNLDGGSALTEQDTQVIRTFMVSDAESYLAHENNYDAWLDELRRLLGDMANRTTSLDRDSISDLRGVIKDAVRLVPSIRNYFAEKQRVARFDTAMHALDASSRKLMSELLREQMSSSSR